MFNKDKKSKEREKTRDRVRRFRERQKEGSVTTVTESVTGGVTDSKMVCRCKYFHVVDGVRVCVQCGKPPKPPKLNDKIRRGIEFKSKEVMPCV